MWLTALFVDLHYNWKIVQVGLTNKYLSMGGLLRSAACLCGDTIFRKYKPVYFSH